MADFDKNLPQKDILLVDDDQDLKGLIVRVLKKMNYSVVEASSFEEAVNKLLSYRFSLVLTDINLGGLSGLDLLTWCKQNTPIVRVILMTGYLEDTDIHDALELGVFGFLAKPVAKKEIQKVVKNALGNSPEDKITDVDYARVDVEDFLTGKVLNFPVYIRLKDARFLKIAHSGTEVDMDRINALKNKGIHELWIDQDDLPAYIALNEKILTAKNSWTPATKVKFLNHFAEICYESMRLLNFSERSIRYCLDSLNQLVKEITQKDNTFSLVSPMAQGEGRSSQIAVLGASYSLVLAKVLDWKAEKTLNSLALGAFFRDIALSQAGFDYKDFLNKGQNYDKALYREHPEKGAQILENLKIFPTEVINIVQQHHEDGSSDSFPYQLPRSRIYAPALLVNYVDKMIFYMMSNSDLPPEKIKNGVLNMLQHKLPSNDEKAAALITLIKKGDIDLAKKEIDRIKKLSQ